MRRMYSMAELLFCLLASVALTMNVVQGFVLPEALYGAPVRCVAVELPWLWVLFLVGRSRKTRRMGIPILVVAAVGVIFLLRRWDIPVIETEIAENNAGLWYLLAVVVTFPVYLSSRRVGGCCILLVLGALTHGWLCLLQYTFSLWYMVMYLWAGIALLLLVRYRRQVTLTRTNAPAWGAALITAVAVSTGALACAGLLWLGVFAGKTLPKQDVNLITEVVSLEVMEKVGISKTETLLDDDTTAQELDENFDTTTSEQNEEDTADNEDTPQETPMPTQEPWETVLRENVASISLSLTQVRRHYTGVVVWSVIILLVLAGAMTAFHQRHRLWLWRIRRKSPEEQVFCVYHVLRKKLAVLGYPCAVGDTALQYAQKVSPRLAHIEQNGTTWQSLSQIYSRLCYGNGGITQDEYIQFVEYYGVFCKNCRSLCGHGYFWKRFRL